MIAALYLDDLTAGQRFTTGGVTLTEAQIIDFALQYDPQPFHVDAPAASASPFGGLIASGFQTLSLCFRLYIQSGVFAQASLGSPGLDEVRWHLPVRPQDTLHCDIEVIEIRPSRSKTDQGLARLHLKAVNQHGNVAASFYLNHLLRRRPPKTLQA